MKELNYIKESIYPGLKIPPSVTSLPINGVTISSVDFVTNEEGHGITGDFYRICGAIHPEDPEGYDINFQMGFPVTWNGRLVQYGGGGLDGTVTPVEAPAPGRAIMSDTPVKEHYAVCSSDSGHVQKQENPADCHWALNQEALENYAYKALKKLRDLAVYLLNTAYGQKADKIYFAGGSNGGRECLKAIENYPEDYDGAICLYPAHHYIAKVLFDNHYGTLMQEAGEKCLITEEQYQKIQKIITSVSDKADGASDGIISDLSYAMAHRNETRKLLEKELTEEQLDMMDKLSATFKIPFELGYGSSVMPGYAVYEGAPLYETINNFPFFNIYGEDLVKRTNISVISADQVIACMVMKDPCYDVLHLDLEKMKPQLKAASKLIDASADGSALEKFAEKGGKVLLMQGMADPMITPYSTILFYNRMVKYYGQEKLDGFLRFYNVPGYGHGFCNLFAMNTDLLGVLDKWVCDGTEPSAIIIEDANDSKNHRTRPIYQYPYYPEYNGSGDINKAGNFHPQKMDTSQFDNIE